MPPGLFLAGRVSEQAYKPGCGPQEGDAKDRNEPVDEHTARVNADLQALLRINSRKGTTKVGMVLVFC